MASGTTKRWGSRGESKSVAPEIPGYDLRDNIGSGGMGSVWTAIYKPLNQARAVKILDKALARDETFRERFSEEAKAMGRLEHPNIVKVYDANAEFDPPYIAMEWIEGKTFTQILNSRTLPHAEAVGYFEPLAAALDYAHGQGFIHRDIKPANVLITPNGRAYLIDFGIASWLGADSQGNTTLTGTTSYLAPELIQGRLPSFASDIWAFSVMVYRIISGGMPFEGGTPDQILKKIIAENPSDPKVMSPRLKAFLLKLLQKDPSLRYKSARALVADLKVAIDPLTVIGGAKGLGIGAGVVLGAVVLGIALKGGGTPAQKAEAPKGTVASQPTKPTSGSTSKPVPVVPNGTKPTVGGPSSKAVVAALSEFKGVWYADLGTAFAEVIIEPTTGRGVSSTWRLRDSKGAADLALVGELA
jgi:serine/threonine-protein kinase